jgi:hypothetical protein
MLRSEDRGPRGETGRSKCRSSGIGEEPVLVTGDDLEAEIPKNPEHSQAAMW